MTTEVGRVMTKMCVCPWIPQVWLHWESISANKAKLVTLR